MMQWIRAGLFENLHEETLRYCDKPRGIKWDIASPRAGVQSQNHRRIRPQSNECTRHAVHVHRAETPGAHTRPSSPILRCVRRGPWDEEMTSCCASPPMNLELRSDLNRSRATCEDHPSAILRSAPSVHVRSACVRFA